MVAPTINRNNNSNNNRRILLNEKAGRGGSLKLGFLVVFCFYGGFLSHELFSPDLQQELSIITDVPSASSSLRTSTTTSTTAATTVKDSSSPSITSSNKNDNSNNFQLAYDQSFGFFDNISNEDWKLYQERAQTRINHARKFHSSPIQFYNWQPAQWYMNNIEPDFTCAHERRVMGPGDGPKWVCDPHRLPQVAKRRNDGKPCLIYSVGSGGKWEFEDGMYELLEHDACEIHVFDPGNFGKLRKYPEEMEERNIHFHHWGLKSSYDDTYTPNVDYGRFISLQETLEELGHVGRVIDVFKIDCESCEWSSWKDWIDRSKVDIRQLLVETHNLPDDALQGLDYFYGLQQAGFYLFHKEPNIHPKAMGNGIEWGYVRLSKDFFGTNKEIPMYNRTWVQESDVYKEFLSNQQANKNTDTK